MPSGDIFRPQNDLARSSPRGTIVDAVAANEEHKGGGCMPKPHRAPSAPSPGHGVFPLTPLSRQLTPRRLLPRPLSFTADVWLLAPLPPSPRLTVPSLPCIQTISGSFSIIARTKNRFPGCHFYQKYTAVLGPSSVPNRLPGSNVGRSPLKTLASNSRLSRVPARLKRMPNGPDRSAGGPPEQWRNGRATKDGP